MKFVLVMITTASSANGLPGVAWWDLPPAYSISPIIYQSKEACEADAALLLNTISRRIDQRFRVQYACVSQNG